MPLSSRFPLDSLPEIRKRGGQVLPGADVYICNRLDGRLKNDTSDRATVYADETGTTTVTQPIPSDENGNVEFWVPPGSYDRVAYKNGAWEIDRFEASLEGSTLPVGPAAGRLTGDFPAPSFADASMEALADLAPAADKLPYYTGPAGAAVTAFGEYARRLLQAPERNAGVIPCEKYRTGTNSPEDQINLSLEEAAAAVGDPADQVQDGYGRTVLLTEPSYEIAGEIAPDRLVDLVGLGKRASRIVCTAADAGVVFGRRLGDHDLGGSGSTIVYRGGWSGGFLVDGAGIATRPLLIGRSADRSFANMKSIRSASHALLFEGSQNLNLYHVDGDDCVGSVFAFDGGAANNHFWGGHGTRWDRYVVESTQDVNDAADLAAFPYHNVFHGYIFEYTGSVPRGTAGLSLGHVLIRAGQWFGFDDCNFAAQDYTNPTSVIVLVTDNAANAPVMMNRFHIPRILMDTGGTHTAFELRSATAFETVLIEGRLYVSNGSTIFKIADGAKVIVNGPLDANTPTLFAHYGGGTAYQGDLLQGLPGTVDPPWVAFPYNGAVPVGDLGSPWQVVQYRKLPGGRVELRGWLVNTNAGGGAGIAAGSTIGTLPAGFRPATKTSIGSGVGGAATGRFDVNTSGVITNSATIAATASAQLKGEFYTS